MPRVSCVMPMLNAATYVAEAIESILNQTYDDFELIVANDGSTDDSPAIVRAYAERDPRVILLDRSENKGIVYTRNELLDASTGEFSALMDADDIAIRDRFEKQVAFLDSHPDHDAVGSQVLLIDPEGSPMCTLPIRETHEEIDKWHIEAASGTALCNPTVTMRTEAMRAAGAYHDDTIWAEDYDLFLRMAERGKIATMPEVLLHYRQHFSGTGYARNALQREAIHTCVEKACKRRGIPLTPRVLEERVPTRTASYAYRQWARWAMRGGNRATARKYARKSVWEAPWSPRAWYTLARVELGIAD